MVAVQPWWFVFLFCSCASHSYFWGSSMLWLCPSVFQPLEWQSCMQVCSGGREVDCVRRQALPVKGCTAQARSESGWRNGFGFWGGQVVSRSDMAAWLPVQRAWTVGTVWRGRLGQQRLERGTARRG